jgi:Fe-S-cluster containining protein
MLVIQDILISDDITDEKFFCDLTACKGACCTEGDYGAPLEQQEMETITAYIDIIAENLPEKSKTLLEAENGFTFYKKPKVWGTTCHEDGACIFLTKNTLGISVCGIEKTWHEGKIPFQKPISCHLYPIRISTNEIAGFEAWNYDRWDICAAACQKGQKEKMPLYQFVKDAVIRKKGQEFYDELKAAAEHFNEE